ncbi:hypothetical protein SNEBB_009092 [Seison nebaliae]|nr:hypothetical protein SNEBB_009092 [Seison nebaliae]
MNRLYILNIFFLIFFQCFIVRPISSSPSNNKRTYYFSSLPTYANNWKRNNRKFYYALPDKSIRLSPKSRPADNNDNCQKENEVCGISNKDYQCCGDFQCKCSSFLYIVRFNCLCRKRTKYWWGK